jgi:hypothetical protein
MTVSVEWNEEDPGPALGVSAHPYRVPFALIVFESAHQELAMGDGQLDGAEYRFERLLTQGIEFSPVGVLNLFQP